MGLYVVTLEFKVTVYSENKQPTNGEIVDEILNRHAHAILHDNGPFDAKITAERVYHENMIPTKFVNTVPYGSEGKDCISIIKQELDNDDI